MQRLSRLEEQIMPAGEPKVIEIVFIRPDGTQASGGLTFTDSFLPPAARLAARSDQGSNVEAPVTDHERRLKKLEGQMAPNAPNHIINVTYINRDGTRAGGYSVEIPPLGSSRDSAVPPTASRSRCR